MHKTPNKLLKSAAVVPRQLIEALDGVCDTGLKTTELISIIIRLETLLKNNHHDHWLIHVSRCRKLIESKKIEGILKLVRILHTAGPGSFNDIFVAKTDDREFTILKDLARDLAVYIEQHADIV